MTNNQNPNFNPGFKPASKHELQVVAPEAAIRHNVITLATEHVNQADMAAKSANSLSAFMASSPERVGGVAAASFVEPAKPAAQAITDSIIAEVPELAYAEHVDRHDADAAHEADLQEASALKAVNEARMAEFAARTTPLEETYFTDRAEAPIGNSSTPQVGYVEGVADFAAAQRARAAREQIDTFFSDQQAA